ncbi:MAG TPA: ABC transporter permease [Kosmotogaceae bacterium]|nr:MAG: Binding-protein-dependent transport systems inner membrane component [Thermotogales bacterium 46_20]HAA85619.1 ABC transporter permease [Kosmotogaceae bacterium]
MTLSYLIRRMFTMVLTIFLALTFSFLLIRLLPGDPAERYYGDPRLPIEIKTEIKAAFGLDKPVYMQYFIFLGNAVKGDLGISYTYRRSVVGVVMERMPWTLLLTTVPTVLSMVLGLKIGTYIAFNRLKFFDRFMRSVAFALNSVPTFWLALLMVMGFAFYLPIFPLQGMIDPLAVTMPERFFSVLRHAALPWITIFMVTLPSFAVHVRNLTINILGEDFIITAKAKGLKKAQIRKKHVLRNALGPLFSILTLRVAGLVGGSVLIETIFSWRGMGLLVLEASRGSDYPLLQATVLITIILVIVANFVADILQAVFDPRVRYS